MFFNEWYSILIIKNAVHIFVAFNGDSDKLRRAYNKIKAKGDFYAIITSDKSTILDNDMNVRLHSEFFQSNSIHCFELPIVAKTVLDYILNVVFIHTYNKDPEYFSNMIEKMQVKDY